MERNPPLSPSTKGKNTFPSFPRRGFSFKPDFENADQSTIQWLAVEYGYKIIAFFNVTEESCINPILNTLLNIT
jgi:hypothetical protein